MRTQTRRTRRPAARTPEQKATARAEWLRLNAEAERRALRSFAAVQSGRMSFLAAARYSNIYVAPLQAAAHEQFKLSQ